MVCGEVAVLLKLITQPFHELLLYDHVAVVVFCRQAPQGNAEWIGVEGGVKRHHHFTRCAIEEECAIVLTCAIDSGRCVECHAAVAIARCIGAGAIEIIPRNQVVGRSIRWQLGMRTNTDKQATTNEQTMCEQFKQAVHFQ